MSQLCELCAKFTTCNLTAKQLWYNAKYAHYSSGSELHQSAERGCHLCQFFEAALLRCNRTPGDADLPDRQIWLQCVQQSHNHRNNAIQISIEPLSLRSAGYRGPDVHDVDHCIWLEAGNGLEEGLEKLEDISNGPIGKLGPVTGIVVHNTGRMYFYRGRTLTADVFYAVRQPYYRAEVHCILIPVDDNTGSFANMYLIIAWLNSCSAHHPACLRYSDAAGQLPSRVLDVGYMKSEGVRLHISKTEEKDRYIALSHRWGKTNPLTTTTKTLPERVAGISLTSLSQTFREAIYVTWSLDIRYLWIDSLCILQDSQDDWKQQSALMGAIYRQAFMTIAATDTEDATSGLFFARNPTKIKPCKLHLPLRKDMFAGELGCLYATSPHFRCGGDIRRVRGPLDTRAWVLQEQILSGRVLNFTKDQVYFECLSTEASEDLPYTLDNALDDDAHYVSTLKYGIGGLLPIDQPKTSNYLHRAWYLMVEDYSRRQLTVPTDKWVAILGIVTELQRATEDICSFGLWNRWLAHDLLWSVYSASYPRTSLKQSARLTHGPNGKRNTTLSAPSWSWLQIEGHIQYLTDSYNDVLHDQVLVQEIEMRDAEITATPSNEHKNLPRLRIRGHLKPGIPALRGVHSSEDLPEGPEHVAALPNPEYTAIPQYPKLAEPDLVSAALDPTDDRATRTWRIASDLEEEIYGPKTMIDEDEPIIGIIPHSRLRHIIHADVLTSMPAAYRRMTELYKQDPRTNEQHRAFVDDQHNKYVVATMVNKTPIGFWAPDVDGELAVPRVEELANLSNEQMPSLLFLGVCRGGGWVQCLGLQLVGTGLDAMLANVWRRLGIAWILEEAWDQTGGIEAEVTLI
ncbi:HET-domain-containing protein [Cenococcum geophilum 1.58]|uniref:HET-domain-containing protein n=1 Tax=Cenococcum geophilum 1.58 TaxID=794803 RepID=UPI00358F1A26|nr:HET-domain-containing protein [Cenococcum geophilum 1.58]